MRSRHSGRRRAEVLFDTEQVRRTTNTGNRRRDRRNAQRRSERSSKASQHLDGLDPGKEDCQHRVQKLASQGPAALESFGVGALGMAYRPGSRAFSESQKCSGIVGVFTVAATSDGEWTLP